MQLLIATHNAGKKREYAELLADLGYELLTLDEAGIIGEVEETGQTFEENAILKAKEYAAISGMMTLADDSGLNVDALHGEPGVYSARYGGQGLDDRDRFELVLDKLRNVPRMQRTARFCCVIAVAWPEGRLETASGACEGLIADEPHGEHGFGYDPVFYLPTLGKTMAELDEKTKNQLSHRARAATAIRAVLRP